MRLCRINHFRCDEPEGYLFVLGPNKLTRDQFQKDVIAAKNTHIEEAKGLKELGPKPKYPQHPNIKDYSRDTTCGSLMDEYDKQLLIYKTWHAQQEKTLKSFFQVLESKGYQRLSDIGSYLYDDEDEEETPEVSGTVLHTTVYWGHNHGVTLKMDKDKELIISHLDPEEE